VRQNVFAYRLKELRHINKGLTQSQLAQELHIGKSTISNYENGYSTPDIETLMKIAIHFDVSTDYLLGRTNDVLKESEGTPYVRANKIPLFKEIVEPDIGSDSQKVETYITKPEQILADYKSLFAYIISIDNWDSFGFGKQDILYVSETKTKKLQAGEFAIAFEKNHGIIIGKITEDQKTTLRGITRDGNSVLLDKENPSYKILGRIVGVFKSL